MATIEERLVSLENRVSEIEEQLHPQRTIEEIEADEYDEPEIDWEEQREEKEADIAGNCKCGAWQFTSTGIIHVADCCCGAE